MPSASTLARALAMGLSRGTQCFKYREHGEHPTMILRHRAQSELVEDVRHVAFDGTDCHNQLFGDTHIRASLRDQGQHITLPRRELGQRAVGARPADHPLNDLGIER